MSANVIVAVYEAVGGPKNKRRDETDGLMAGPTDKGEYVFAYCGKASDPKHYRFWSRVRWGTPLREKNGVLQVYVKRRWRPLKNFTPATKKDILDYHEELYGTRRVPQKWVFNDFGHLACRYFKDLDKNGRRDKNERIHKEILHTTPIDEARSAQGKPVYLSESHGCIHVKPKDIDEMKENGFLKPGNKLIVHKYTKAAPTGPRGPGGPPFEVHFFPGPMRIVVKGHAPRSGSRK